MCFITMGADRWRGAGLRCVCEEESTLERVWLVARCVQLEAGYNISFPVERRPRVREIGSAVPGRVKKPMTYKIDNCCFLSKWGGERV